MSENLKKIRQIVEEVFDIKISDKRNTEVMEAKCTYSYLAQKYTNHSIEEIADELGMNHAAIVNHINKTYPVFMKNEGFEYLANKCDEKVIDLKLNNQIKIERLIKDYKLTKSMKEKWEKCFNKIEKELKQREVNPDIYEKNILRNKIKRLN